MLKRYRKRAIEMAQVIAELIEMVKRILRKDKYPPDQQEGAIELVLQQAKALGETWMGP